jgi:hypothetical protein
MAFVVQPSARAAFAPRELADAYEDFGKRAPQDVDDETGIKAKAYRFGDRVLLVYQKSEGDVVMLIHPTS